jgi:hypothetical protein
MRMPRVREITWRPGEAAFGLRTRRPQRPPCPPTIAHNAPTIATCNLHPPPPSPPNPQPPPAQDPSVAAQDPSASPPAPPAGSLDLDPYTLSATPRQVSRGGRAGRGGRGMVAGWMRGRCGVAGGVGEAGRGHRGMPHSSEGAEGEGGGGGVVNPRGGARPGTCGRSGPPWVAGDVAAVRCGGLGGSPRPPSRACGPPSLSVPLVGPPYSLHPTP